MENQFALFSYTFGYNGYTLIGRLAEHEYDALPDRQDYRHFAIFTASSHSSDLLLPDEVRWKVDNNSDIIAYNPNTNQYETLS